MCLFGLQIAVHVDLKLSDSSRIAYDFLYGLDLKVEHVQDSPFGSGSGSYGPKSYSWMSLQSELDWSEINYRFIWGTF